MTQPNLTRIGAETIVEAECRTLDLGIQGFAECLRQGPSRCKYALPFGYAFLCQHPRLCRGTSSSEKEGSSRSAANSFERRN
jgi:hypothetical protein